MICGDCKHWAGSGTTDRGACKRYPPVAGGVVMAQGLSGPQPIIMWSLPETPRGDYCGEWEKAATLSLVSA